MHLYGLKGFEDLERYSKYSQLSSSTNGAGKGYFLTLAMVYVDLTLGDVERLRGVDELRHLLQSVAVCPVALLGSSDFQVMVSMLFFVWHLGINRHQSASIGINRHQGLKDTTYDCHVHCTLVHYSYISQYISYQSHIVSISISTEFLPLRYFKIPQLTQILDLRTLKHVKPIHRHVAAEKQSGFRHLLHVSGLSRSA